MQTLPLAAWLLPLGGGRRKLWTLDHTRTSMEMLFGEDVHLARVRSLANGVAGVLNASVVSIAAIGRAYAYLAMIERRVGSASTVLVSRVGMFGRSGCFVGRRAR